MRLFFVLLISLTMVSCNRAADLVLVKGGHAAYSLIIPMEFTANERKAAAILQYYIEQLSGVKIPVIQESASTGKSPGIYIGNTEKAQGLNTSSVQGEGYLLALKGEDLVLFGKHGQGVVYAVYAFIEQYFHLFKGANEPVNISRSDMLSISNFNNEISNPAFVYRQAYFPASQDTEYLAWHKLQHFEDLWGIWGHSYFKLVDPALYFKAHPEYFSEINGIREPLQLCMSNEEAVAIAINELKKRMSKFPDAEYWSVSANDDLNYCTCDKCRAVAQEEGGPSGAHLRFVNRIAAAFPDKKFTTLAYLHTARPPVKTKPLPNVYIMLSTIDAYRSRDFQHEPSAQAFISQAKGWRQLTENLMVWDYNIQFTNFLSPFPDLFFLGDNIRLFQSLGIKGIFAQGSGESYSDLSELRSYLLAKLSWSPQTDVRKLINEFCHQYYGPAAPSILAYIDSLQEEAFKSGRRIDIYGNPVWEYNSYLSPEKIEQYSKLLDKASADVENDTLRSKRVEHVRLSLEYAVLQQSRFFGFEKHGFLEAAPRQNDYQVKANWPLRVDRFVSAAIKAGVTELAEEGLSPEAYRQEWKEIFQKKWQPGLALHASVQLTAPFAPEYPNRGAQTLTDGMPGYRDFSYNWLCFYGQDLVATIDLAAPKKISQVQLNFLDDPRHRIFLPASLNVSVSIDGKKYEPVQSNDLQQLNKAMEEHYTIGSTHFIFSFPRTDIRYIKVNARNHDKLPQWRYHPNKKPMIAIDEISAF